MGAINHGHAEAGVGCFGAQRGWAAVSQTRVAIRGEAPKRACGDGRGIERLSQPCRKRRLGTSNDMFAARPSNLERPRKTCCNGFTVRDGSYDACHR
jgi:hypothetical protein